MSEFKNYLDNEIANIQEGGLILPTPNLHTGYGPGFGIDTSVASVPVPAGQFINIPWSTAYTFENGAVTTLVENSYMSWDPDNTPDVITIQQSGWYWIATYLTFATPLVGFIQYTENTASVQGSALGYMRDGERSIQFFDIVYCATNFPDIRLGIDANNLTEDNAISYTGIIMVPLFPLVGV